MTLDDALSGIDAVRPEIEAYRTAAFDMKVGAENESKYNPGAPSSAPLTEQVKTAGQCVAKADAALAAIDSMHASFAALTAQGYPELPMTLASPEAIADLTADKAQIDVALSHMVVAGATAVVKDEVGPEQPRGAPRVR